MYKSAIKTYYVTEYVDTETGEILKKTGIIRRVLTKGDSIEQQLEKIIAKKEPIESTAPLIYTEKKKGVLPGYNIRTDRFEIALDGMDLIHKSNQAKRENALKLEQENAKKSAETEPAGGTE